MRLAELLGVARRPGPPVSGGVRAVSVAGLATIVVLILRVLGSDFSWYAQLGLIAVVAVVGGLVVAGLVVLVERRQSGVER